MKPAYLKWSLALSLGGTFFAGYLSFYKLFAKSCAFSEPCSLFLGQPACWYGLAMFALMLGASLLSLYGPFTMAMAARANATISFFGMLFSGYITWTEAASWFSGGVSGYQLGLPTCAYGLMFYVIIFVISIRHARNANALA
jgi:hypothetical protein